MVSQMQEQQQELGQATPAIHYLDTKLLAKNDTIHKLQFQQRTSNSGTHKLVQLKFSPISSYNFNQLQAQEKKSNNLHFFQAEEGGGEG